MSKSFWTKCEHCGWVGSSKDVIVHRYHDDADTACPACRQFFMCEEANSIKCMACGIDRDMSIKERCVDGKIFHSDALLDPIQFIDCERNLYPYPSDWRTISVCVQCFTRLEPDIWVSENCWKSLDPVTPFEKLPKMPENTQNGD